MKQYPKMEVSFSRRSHGKAKEVKSEWRGIPSSALSKEEEEEEEEGAESLVAESLGGESSFGESSTTESESEVYGKGRRKKLRGSLLSGMNPFNKERQPYMHTKYAMYYFPMLKFIKASGEGLERSIDVAVNMWDSCDKYGKFMLRMLVVRATREHIFQNFIRSMIYGCSASHLFNRPLGIILEYNSHIMRKHVEQLDNYLDLMNKGKETGGTVIKTKTFMVRHGNLSTPLHASTRLYLQDSHEAEPVAQFRPGKEGDHRLPVTHQC